MKAHHHSIVPCGLVLIGICLFIRYHIGRRRFNRRGIGGLQQFPTYGKAVTISFLEKMILFIANLSGWAGVFLLAIAGFNHFKF